MQKCKVIFASFTPLWWKVGPFPGRSRGRFVRRAALLDKYSTTPNALPPLKKTKERKKIFSYVANINIETKGMEKKGKEKMKDGFPLQILALLERQNTKGFVPSIPFPLHFHPLLFAIQMRDTTSHHVPSLHPRG